MLASGFERTRLRPFLAAFVALACFAGRAYAQSDATRDTGTYSLSFVRGAGAEGCPSRQELEREVSTRLGRSPFDSSAERSIEILTEHGPDGYRSVVSAIDRDGKLLGRRTLMSGDASCAPIFSATALAVALLVDPEAALSRDSGANEAVGRFELDEPTAPPPLPPTIAPTPAPRSNPPPPPAPEPAPPLYAEHCDFVWRSLQHLGVRGADLEDLMQEVFVVVHRKLGGFDGVGRITTWLFGICLRVVASHRRRAHFRFERQAADVPEIVDTQTPEDHAATQERTALLERALGRLSLEHRAVFVLFEIEGFRSEEIAETLGVPVGTVHSRLFKARRIVARSLERAKLGGKP